MVFGESLGQVIAPRGPRVLIHLNGRTVVMKVKIPTRRCRQTEFGRREIGRKVTLLTKCVGEIGSVFGPTFFYTYVLPKYMF